mmetsp:Transcript_10777/g.23380  ORF Transcript_10777/g.23380 Transcript_10777/m.23380 type:complete len:240 (-) Transcript_10777:122-841(-)
MRSRAAIVSLSRAAAVVAVHPHSAVAGLGPAACASSGVQTLSRRGNCHETSALVAAVRSSYRSVVHVRFQQFSTPSAVGPPPRIFDFIIQLRFDEVLKRVQSHPHEASYPHPRRWTALHACAEYGAPVEVVKALVSAYPDALEMKDWRGHKPVDIALSDELKEYLASVDIESLEGQNRSFEQNLETNTTTSSSRNVSLAGDDVSRDQIIRHVDKISHQIGKLNDEIRLLKATLKGETKK